MMSWVLQAVQVGLAGSVGNDIEPIFVAQSLCHHPLVGGQHDIPCMGALVCSTVCDRAAYIVVKIFGTEG
jgi:hypothetical protein